MTAAHDVSDGGLGITLAEMAVFSKIGADVTLEELGDNLLEILFSEAQSGIVVTAEQGDRDELESYFKAAAVPVYKIGTTGGDQLNIKGLDALNIQELDAIYEEALPKRMGEL